MRDWCELLFENTSSLMLNLLIRLCFLLKNLIGKLKIVPPRHIKEVINKYSGEDIAKDEPQKSDSGLNKDILSAFGATP
jgi:hypothetical protein